MHTRFVGQRLTVVLRSKSLPKLLLQLSFLTMYCLTQNSYAQQLTVPEIPAFLPSITKVKPTQTMVIDGLWTISSLNKLVRIDRGRIYAIEGWTHMFVLKIQPGMVVIQNLVEDGLGSYKGDDLPLAGPLTAQLTGDRVLDVTVDGKLGPVKYQMIPQELDDPDWFKKEIKAIRKRQ